MTSAAEGLTAPYSSPTKAVGGTAPPNQRYTSSSSSYLSLVSSPGDTFSSGLGQFIHNQNSLSSGNGNDAIIPEWKQEEKMADISKEELSALLRANKAEVDAVASAMKAEMATWREQMRSDLKDVKTSVERQTDKLESNFTSQQTKLDAAIQIQTARLEKTVSDTRVDIIKWVLGIPALAFTLWKIYESIPR